jgi:hypothetical protein
MITANANGKFFNRVSNADEQRIFDAMKQARKFRTETRKSSDGNVYEYAVTQAPDSQADFLSYFGTVNCKTEVYDYEAVQGFLSKLHVSYEVERGFMRWIEKAITARSEGRIKANSAELLNLVTNGATKWDLAQRISSDFGA